jgi:carboxyl-terminal processing protease
VLAQIDGSFVGLGVELKADGDSLRIVGVIPGGPADQAGIRVGDRIVQVEGKSTADISTDIAADMLKGPEGTQVELVLVGPDEQPRYTRATRTLVEVPSVEHVRIVDAQYGVGYLRLASFQKTTSRDVESALWELHRQGMRCVIVDVRGNPGGLLTAAVEVADKFLAQGAIVSTRGRSSGEDYDYKAHLIGTWRVPLIVLIDRDSASASEIFAGAIHDHRRGVLIGDRSFGKGSVQGIFPLNIAQLGVRLTTAKFYSPSGTAISHRGVDPDITVHTVARAGDRVEPVAAGDAVVDAAVQVARRQLSGS